MKKSACEAAACYRRYQKQICITACLAELKADRLDDLAYDGTVSHKNGRMDEDQCFL